MEGRHFRAGSWSFMVHGFVNAVFSGEGGPRGETEGYFTNMLMGMGARPLGGARLGLRAMVALEPALGPEGYPLLLQTGETADGRTNLVDRQHPHDAFMELAASLGIPVGGKSSVWNLASSRFTTYAPRRATDAWLLESSVRLGRAHTVFGRAEQVDKDELFPVNDPFHSRVFPMGKVEAGYVWDVLPRSPLVPGLGLAAGVHFLPEFLEPDYGRRPKSLLVFARLKLR